MAGNAVTRRGNEVADGASFERCSKTGGSRSKRGMPLPFNVRINSKRITTDWVLILEDWKFSFTNDLKLLRFLLCLKSMRVDFAIVCS